MNELSHMPPTSLFDALAESLSIAAAFNKDAAVAPAVVLWTDENREWEALVPRFRQALPNSLIKAISD